VHDAHPEHFAEVSQYFCKTATWHTLEEVAHLQLCKVAIYHPNAATHLYPHLTTYATSEIRVILSGPNWVDVQRATIDKARALEALVQKYNLTLHNVMVFGDYFNDVGMLTCGVHAVAMGNALPEIRALTPHHALPNTQNGVMHYLHSCNLININTLQ
jgi:HAD superfamily hydrolase (TIGR01484 family)